MKESGDRRRVWADVQQVVTDEDDEGKHFTSERLAKSRQLSQHPPRAFRVDLEYLEQRYNWWALLNPVGVSLVIFHSPLRLGSLKASNFDGSFVAPACRAGEGPGLSVDLDSGGQYLLNHPQVAIVAIQRGEQRRSSCALMSILLSPTSSDTTS